MGTVHVRVNFPYRRLNDGMCCLANYISRCRLKGGGMWDDKCGMQEKPPRACHHLVMDINNRTSSFRRTCSAFTH